MRNAIKRIKEKRKALSFTVSEPKAAAINSLILQGKIKTLEIHKLLF